VLSSPSRWLHAQRLNSINPEAGVHTSGGSGAESGAQQEARERHAQRRWWLGAVVEAGLVVLRALPPSSSSHTTSTSTGGGSWAARLWDSDTLRLRARVTAQTRVGRAPSEPELTACWVSNFGFLGSRLVQEKLATPLDLGVAWLRALPVLAGEHIGRAAQLTDETAPPN
jgi:hypothetical protein